RGEVRDGAERAEGGDDRPPVPKTPRPPAREAEDQWQRTQIRPRGADELQDPLALPARSTAHARRWEMREVVLQLLETFVPEGEGAVREVDEAGQQEGQVHHRDGRQEDGPQDQRVRIPATDGPDLDAGPGDSVEDERHGAEREP